MDVRLVRISARSIDASWIGREMIVGSACGALSDIEADRRGRVVALFVGGTRVPVRHGAVAIYDTLCLHDDL